MIRGPETIGSCFGIDRFTHSTIFGGLPVASAAAPAANWNKFNSFQAMFQGAVRFHCPIGEVKLACLM